MAAGEKVIPEITVGNQTYKLMDETAREHLVEVKSTTPTSEDNRLWIKEMSAAEEEANTYEVPTIDEFNDLTSALYMATGNGAIPMSDGYLGLTGSTPIDPTNPTISQGYKHAFVECNAGDLFTVNASGGATPRAWGFLDSTKTPMSERESSNARVIDKIIEAPTDAKYLVINNKENGLISYFGESMKKIENEHYESLSKDLNGLKYYTELDTLYQWKPFESKAGDDLFIETADGSNFTIQRLEVKNENGGTDYVMLSSKNTNAIHVSFAIDTTQARIKDGTVQDCYISNRSSLYNYHNSEDAVYSTLVGFPGEKISILGDSIDTFNKAGYKIDGYAMHYPNYDVKDVNQTWWMRVINASNAKIEVNASYAGSRVTNTDTHNPQYPDFYDRVSLLGSPDTIFVTLGSNDSYYNVALGDYDFTTAYTSLSESTFRTAYIKGVKALIATYPTAKIVCIAEDMKIQYKDSIRYIAENLGCKFIDASDYVSVSGSHPGVYGMKQIAHSVLNPIDDSLTQKGISADSLAVGNSLKDGALIFTPIEETVFMKKSTINGATSSGWKLTENGERIAEPTSELKTYTVFSGQYIYVKFEKYTEVVCCFWDSNSNLVGEVVHNSVDGVIKVPENATKLVCSMNISNTSNAVYAVRTAVDFEKSHANGVFEVQEMKSAIEYVKGLNRFDKSKQNYLDGYYIQNGLFYENESYFVTHIMEVDPSTTYYKRESAHGIVYDRFMNEIDYPTGLSFTTPANAKYYRTCCTNSGKNMFYVSTENAVSAFSDAPKATNDAKTVIEDIIQESSIIDTRVDSVVSKYVNATPYNGGAVVSFIDDDGKANVYTRLYPIMQTKNVPFGAALITGYIGEENMLTLAQVQTMFDSGLLETMSHTHNHVQIDEITLEQVDYQCSTSKQWLVDHEFDSQGLVLPHNTSNLASRRIARQYFGTLYTAYAFNDKGYIDPNQIQRIGFGSFAHGYNPVIDGVASDDDMTYYKAAVDKAIQTNSWLVFMTHINDQPSSADEDLAELIDYIKGAGVPILKPKDAFELKRNMISVGDIKAKYLFVANDGYATNISHYQSHTSTEVEGGAKQAVTPDKYPPNVVSVIQFNYNSGSGYPGTAGILETYYNPSAIGWSWQKWYKYHSPDSYYRYWDDTNNRWSEFVQVTAAIT